MEINEHNGAFLPDAEPDAFETIITIGIRYVRHRPRYRLDVSAASEFGLELEVEERHSDAALMALCDVAPAIVRLDQEMAGNYDFTRKHLLAVRDFVTAWRSFIRCTEIPLGALQEVPYIIDEGERP